MIEISQKKRRIDFISQYIDDLSKIPILEIGSLNSPTFKKDRYNIYFADYISQSELKEKYPHKSQNIHEVDFIVNIDKPYCESINTKFNLVIANHVIEHIPDIISWLNDISSITCEGGILFLAVPHKMYTFDISRQ